MTPSTGERGGSRDWNEIRSRLARAQGAHEPSPAEVRELLARRARALALPPRRADDGGADPHLIFSLAKERYAVDAGLVREVARLSDLTPVPGTPAFLAGVTNLRGEVLTVVDLRPLLGVTSSGLTDLSRLVVLGTDRSEFAILADEAHAVSALRADALTQPPGSVAGIGRDFLRGVTRDMLIVLDGRVLLTDPRLFAAAPGARKA